MLHGVAICSSRGQYSFQRIRPCIGTAPMHNDMRSHIFREGCTSFSELCCRSYEFEFNIFMFSFSFLIIKTQCFLERCVPSCAFQIYKMHNIYNCNVVDVYITFSDFRNIFRNHIFIQTRKIHYRGGPRGAGSDVVQKAGRKRKKNIIVQEYGARATTHSVTSIIYARLEILQIRDALYSIVTQ
jgi:hypothetical protein